MPPSVPRQPDLLARRNGAGGTRLELVDQARPIILRWAASQLSNSGACTSSPSRNDGRLARSRLPCPRSPSSSRRIDLDPGRRQHDLVEGNQNRVLAGRLEELAQLAQRLAQVGAGLFLAAVRPEQ